MDKNSDFSTKYKGLKKFKRTIGILIWIIVITFCILVFILEDHWRANINTEVGLYYSVGFIMYLFFMVAFLYVGKNIIHIIDFLFELDNK